MTDAVYQDRIRKTEATIAARAEEVFLQHRRWRFAHRKADGHPFFMMDGSPVARADGTVEAPVYYVDLHDCTCPSHREGHLACKHMRAARLWYAAVKRGEIAVPRRMTAGDAAVLETAAEEAAGLDAAATADALLDAYDAQRERERAWWLRGNGGVVWLETGDRIGPDTEELHTV